MRFINAGKQQIILKLKFNDEKKLQMLKKGVIMGSLKQTTKVHQKSIDQMRIQMKKSKSFSF